MWHNVCDTPEKLNCGLSPYTTPLFAEWYTSIEKSPAFPPLSTLTQYVWYTTLPAGASRIAVVVAPHNGLLEGMLLNCVPYGRKKMPAASARAVPTDVYTIKKAAIVHANPAITIAAFFFITLEGFPHCVLLRLSQSKSESVETCPRCENCRDGNSECYSD